MKKQNILVISLLLLFIFVSISSAQKVIQTQPSSDGTIEASLIEAKVKRDVLTIKVALKNISQKTIEPEIRFEHIYYTDIEAKKKFFGLKDAAGHLIAGPAHYDWGGGTFKSRISPGERAIIWIKFPAPLETTTAIDIFIPGILPFEDIKILR